jgi:hypothetical protein
MWCGSHTHIPNVWYGTPRSQGRCEGAGGSGGSWGGTVFRGSITYDSPPPFLSSSSTTLLARPYPRVSRTGPSISLMVGLSLFFLLSDNQTDSEEFAVFWLLSTLRYFINDKAAGVWSWLLIYIQYGYLECMKHYLQASKMSWCDA